MKYLFLSFSLMMIFSCQAKKTTTLTIDLGPGEKQQIEVIRDFVSVFLTPDENGLCVYEYEEDYPSEFYVGVESATIPVYVEPGEDCYFELELGRKGDEIVSVNVDNICPYYSKIMDYMISQNAYMGSIVTEDFLAPEDQFAAMVDKCIENHIVYLESLDLNKKFKEVEKQKIKYRLLFKLADHEMGYEYLNRIDPDEYSMGEKCIKHLESKIDNDPNIVSVLGDYYAFLYKLYSRVYRIGGEDLKERLFNFVNQFKKDIDNAEVLNGILFIELYNYLDKSAVIIDDDVINLVKDIKGKRFRRILNERIEGLKSVENHEKAYNFSGVDMKGNKVKLSDLKGKLVVVDIWASWCRPCMMCLPSFVDAQKKYRLKPVHFVTICIDNDIELWKRKVKELGIEGVCLFAEDGNKLLKEFALTGIPGCLLIDKDGHIITNQAPRADDNLFETTINSYLK